MKLAVILPTLAGGGMERMRLHLIQEWLRNGVEVDLVVSRFEGELCDQVPESVQVYEVARRHPLLFPFGLRRYLKSHRPTHILSAANDVNALTLLVVRQVGGGIPVVISVHSHLTSELLLAKGLKRLKGLIVVWMLRRMIQHARGVIAVSRGVADDLQQHFRFREGQLHVIYNPVISTEVRRRLLEPLKWCPVPEDTPWIVYAGRLVPVKGVDVLMDAFERIADRTNAHLVLMGDGPIKPGIVARAGNNGLGSRIHLVGFQANPLPWIREADVLVLPSRHEGLGNVLVEALACGTQIVSTDCPGGPAEVLDGGKYGQLVPVADVGALAGALLRCLDQKSHVPSHILQERAALFSSEQAAGFYRAVIEGYQYAASMS